MKKNVKGKWLSHGWFTIEKKPKRKTNIIKNN